MKFLLLVLLSSVMFGCGGGDDNNQSKDNGVNTFVTQNAQPTEQPSNTNLNQDIPSTEAPSHIITSGGHASVPSATENSNQPQSNTPMVPQSSAPSNEILGKITATYDLFLTPSNYETNSYLQVYEQLDSKNNIQETQDLILKCSWKIKGKQVSDSCFYQLSGDDYLNPITITTYLQNKNGLKTELSDTVFQKSFPITHRQTPSGDALLMSDGKILSWNPPTELASNEIREKLPPENLANSRNFIFLESNKGAFIAIDNDKKITTWGNRKQGGDAPEFILSKKLNRVVTSDYAFSALSEDGKVYLWGYLDGFNVEQEVPIEGRVTALHGLSNGFIALTDDGNAHGFGVDIPLSSQAVGSIRKVVSPKVSNGSTKPAYGMALLNNTGHVYMWGSYANKLPILDDVVDIIANNKAYAALRKNGDVIVWGDATNGGEFKYSLHKREYVNGRFTRNTSWMEVEPPKNVMKVVASNGAFAALQKDGKVVTWGDGFSGGNIYSIKSDKNIQNKVMSDIHANEAGFIGIDTNGDVTPWGYWWITDDNLVSYNAAEHPNWQGNPLEAVGKGEYQNLTSNSVSFAYSISSKDTSEFFSIGRIETGGGNAERVNALITKITPHECGYSAFSSTGDVYGWFGCDSNLERNIIYDAKPYEIVK
ncbi:hypothetical protein [Aeromonas veronii]|uniref:hypothetical protein n=1 Tax=Aeromonas veronii TaxID=654 RepID=UPI00330CF413|nr:hypothetical protein [Aeromonas veronii]